jgi:hypothetical protein
VLNHSWLGNFPEQLPFSDSGMQIFSRINEGDIRSFRKRYGLVISCAQDYMQIVRNDSPEKTANVFLSNCNRQWIIGSVTPFVEVTRCVWHLYWHRMSETGLEYIDRFETKNYWFRCASRIEIDSSRQFSGRA